MNPKPLLLRIFAPVMALCLLVSGWAMAQQAPGTPANNVMIILDSSYSMAEPLGNGGETKMNAAKRTVLDVIRKVPPGTRVGLRVYGDSDNRFSACRATRQLVPLGDNNRMQIASKLIGIKPTGATPISYTIVRSLEEDFIGAVGPKSIILVSDGIETCGEDPCDVAVRMQRQGIDVKLNVVGFGISDYAANKQLRCVALATKGRFYSANTAAELANSLNNAMAVKTNVQATIVVPTEPNAPAPQTTPAPSPNKPYEEELLPAVVPNGRQTR